MKNKYLREGAEEAWGELAELSREQINLLKGIQKALEEMDVSIDQLSGILSGIDPWALQMRQKTFGRLYNPTAKGPPKGKGPVAEMKTLAESWNRYLSETQGKK